MNIYDLLEPGQGLIFIRFLLGKSNERKETAVLLIDFDGGEILDPEGKGEPLEQRGTPIFMARAVLDRGTPQLWGAASFDPIPTVKGVYEKVHSDRLSKFPATEEIVVSRRQAQSIPPPVWRHELRHDAESTFLFLLFWAIRIRPASGTSTSVTRLFTWARLLSDCPLARTSLFTSLVSTDVDPAYIALIPLLTDLGFHLAYDPHWAPMGPLKHPEYCHEAMQRLIFTFLSDEKSQAMLDLEASDSKRHVQRVSSGGLRQVR